MKNKTTVCSKIRFIILSTVLFLSSAVQSQIQSKKADDFINSIGVATHIDRSTGPYSNGANVRTQLLNMGIKHIRDQIRESNVTNYTIVKNLADNGIKMTGFLHGDFGNAALTPAWWLQQVKDAGALYAYEAFEGANEADLGMMGFTYKGQGWPNGVKNFQIDLYNTVKNDAAISVNNRVVLGPTIGNGTKDAWVNQMGDISAYVDYGNMHYYKAWGETYSEGFPGWDLQSMINIHRGMFGTKPFMATEGSYSSAVQADAGVNEAVNAKYTLRYYLEYWRLGVVRTFKYELFDGGTSNTDLEQKFGLIAFNGTTIKPAGTALKNMITLLSEPSPATSFTPATLNFTITNADSYTHYNLLQKSNGKFYLVIWNDAPSWNSDTKSEVNNSDAITITFNQSVAEAKLYNPYDGASVVTTTTSPASLNITVQNHPSIYEITTGSGTGTTAPAVTTTAISAITSTTASSGGNVTNGGSSSVTARGVCWNTAANPTISNNKTTDGTGTGIFTSSIAGLTAGTVYNVRAYATNSAGTSYGSNVTFTSTGGSACGTTVTSDNFDSGWGNWTDGGTDASLINNGAYANSGTFSAMVRDNTNTSVISTNNLNLSSYSSIEVSFSYTTVSMETGEDFWFQRSNDGGATYTTVKSYVRGTDFSNGTRYFQTVTLNGPFTGTTRLRFRNDASADDDQVYIDNVIVNGCTGASGTSTIIDDAAAGWTWSGLSADASCGGCYAVTNRQGNTVGAFGQYTFTGNKLEAYCEAWSGAGSVEVFIDGISRGTFSQVISPEGGQKLFATIPNLTDALHTVKFVAKNTGWMSIDFIKVFTGGSVARIKLPETITIKEELSSSLFSVYPNPVKGNELSINLKGFSKYNQLIIEVVSTAGSEVYSNQMRRPVEGWGIQKINLLQSSLKGMYLIIIKTNDRRFVKKLLFE